MPSEASHIEISADGILKVHMIDSDQVEAIGQVVATQFAKSTSAPIYGTFGENGFEPLVTVSLDR